MSDLRTTRERADLSRREAAALLGVSERTLEGWEAGKGKGYVALATRLLRILTEQEEVRR